MRLAKPKLIEIFARLWKDKRGGVMVYTAIALPVLLGVSGLSVDIGSWYASRRIAQAAADAGALAGAVETVRTDISANINTAALASAAENGYDSAGGDTIQINRPPTSGSFISTAGAVEVIVQRPAALYLAGILFDEPVTVAARSVAVGDINDTCVFALDPSASRAINISGSATVNLPCGMFANSDDPDAIVENGSGCATATSIKTAGGTSGNCLNPTPVEYVNPIPDPFAELQPPPNGGCTDNTNYTVNSGNTVTLDPGVYCGRFNVQSGGTLNFNPGTYVLDRAGLTVGSGGFVNGSDVTFYITGDSGVSDNLSFAGSSHVDLSAPSNGEYAGILFFQAPNSANNITHRITGGSTMTLDGVIYFPNQDLHFSGGTVADPISTMMIARTVVFTGNAQVGDFNGSALNDSPLLVRVTLVE